MFEHDISTGTNNIRPLKQKYNGIVIARIILRYII